VALLQVSKLNAKSGASSMLGKRKAHQEDVRDTRKERMEK
jgi:hypothetical protein